MAGLSPTKKICVVGGGVIGLTTAVRAIENLSNVEITLISKDLSPNTTGDVSAGFWLPYLFGQVEPSLLEYWLDESFSFFLDLCQRPCAKNIGVGLVSSFFELEQDETLENFPGGKQVIGLRLMNENELKLFPKIKRGVFFTSVYAQCGKFLPHLLKRFKENGGKVKVAEVSTFSQLGEDYDIVVNCTGLASYHLVPDTSLMPVRGQVIRVKAPWIKHIINCGNFHILPNADYIQIGGTKQMNNWNLNVDPKDTKAIMEGCCDLVPSMKNAEVLDIAVGLRPYREKGPRVEIEEIVTPKKRIPIIHNYGHGGSGVTISWGCAGTVVQLLNKCLIETHSKL